MPEIDLSNFLPLPSRFTRLITCRELYQVYAKTAPGEVHAILTKYKANYVVLEDSICLAHRERCGLPDIMDLANGHVSVLKDYDL